MPDWTQTYFLNPYQEVEMKFQEREPKLMEVWQRTNNTGPNMVSSKLKDSRKGITYSKLVYNLTNSSAPFRYSSLGLIWLTFFS